MTKHVLVVDDDDSIRETFLYHLERAGYHVTAAATAEEALGLLSEVDPGVVITDIRMPGLDGLELLGRIREEIFQPFFSTRKDGTGLGLSLAARIAENHGGDLKLTDTRGAAQGAEFVVVLPLPVNEDKG